ncbi:hypothetical protein HYW21_02570 [Candidatus Woesearchaeota archaeon]|nr:hypothetical protein [Candidatus Woesearchaeota archaeon]
MQYTYRNAEKKPDESSTEWQDYTKRLAEYDTGYSYYTMGQSYPGGGGSDPGPAPPEPSIPDIELRETSRVELEQIYRFHNTNLEGFLAGRALGIDTRKLRNQFGYSTQLRTCVHEHPVLATLTVVGPLSTLGCILYQYFTE